MTLMTSFDWSVLYVEGTGSFGFQDKGDFFKSLQSLSNLACDAFLLKVAVTLMYQ